MSKFYQITSDYSTYNIVVQNNNIYLGGKYVCIELSSNELYIDKHADCHINENFPIDVKKATDSLKALLYFLKTKYPHLCTIKLTDTSSNIACGSLSSYYICFNKNHTTWYEKDFNAYLENEKIRSIYKIQKEIFNSKEKKDELVMKLEIVLEKKKLGKEQIEFIMDIYNRTHTLNDFFMELRNVSENNKPCPIIKPWLEDFLRFEMGFERIFGEKWIITCDLQEFSNNFIINSIKDNPFPMLKGNYVNIKNKNHYEKYYQQGGKKSLTDIEKHAFKNPHWIGWKKYDIYDFNDKDKRYLKKLFEQISFI